MDLLSVSYYDKNKPLLKEAIQTLIRALKLRSRSNKAMNMDIFQILLQLSTDSTCLPALASHCTTLEDVAQHIQGFAIYSAEEQAIVNSLLQTVRAARDEQFAQPSEACNSERVINLLYAGKERRKRDQARLQALEDAEQTMFAGDLLSRVVSPSPCRCP